MRDLTAQAGLHEEKAALAKVFSLSFIAAVQYLILSILGSPAIIKTVKKSRGKEMSLSRFLGVYYKLHKSDPNAVYLLPNAVYLLQCCFIAANIVWAGQYDNSLFPWKLFKINLTAQQTINTAIKN